MEGPGAAHGGEHAVHGEFNLSRPIGAVEVAGRGRGLGSDELAVRGGSISRCALAQRKQRAQGVARTVDIALPQSQPRQPGVELTSPPNPWSVQNWR